MLIRAPNADLYQRWCAYLRTATGQLTAVERTKAFFSAKAGKQIPLSYS
jgi:hypothetical protein